MNLPLDDGLRNKTKTELGSCTIETLDIDKGKNTALKI
jgi:hypothetical protein